MAEFKVWRSYMGQWDANDIDEPYLVVEARDPQNAAEKWADRKASMDDEIACVVQDPEGKYYEIEMVKKWEVDMYKPTTLEKLCEP